MTYPSTKTFVLFKAAKPKAFSGALGKLTLSHDGQVGAAPYTILDCHDQSVLKSGRLLIEVDGMLILLGEGGSDTQSAERSGDFVADLGDGPVKAALSGLVSPLRCLLTIGHGELTRMSVAVMDDVQKTQARALILTFTPDGKGEPLSVAFLRSLRGYDKALSVMAGHLEALGGSGGFDGQAVFAKLSPKFERYVAKPDIAMVGDETAFQAANDIVAAYLQVARQNEAGIIADLDSEFLHDYRVALRKIRSVVSLFKEVYGPVHTASLKTAFSNLMAPTGRLRDLDVYLLDRDTYFDLVPAPLHDGLEVMFDLFAQERHQQLADLTTHFQSKTYAKEMKKLAKLFANTKALEPGANANLHAHDYACALIWKRYRKVCKIAGRIDDHTEDEEVHELRIHCKKLRYLMEFFAPLFPGKEIKSVIKPLKKLQDNLGLFNDYSVQQDSLNAFLDDHAATDPKKDLAIASSIGALIAVLHQRQLDERARVVSSFATFDSPEVRAKFQTLFHAEGADT